MDESHEDNLILPETDVASATIGASNGRRLKPHATPKLSRERILIIAMGVIIIGLSAALTIVLVNHSNESATELASTITLDTTRYNHADLKAAFDGAEASLRVRDLASADTYLKDYSAVERMTSAERYRYYLIMAELYGTSGYNNPSRAATYQNLAEGALDAIRKGEE